MSLYENKPGVEEWSKLYGLKRLDDVVQRVKDGNVQVWAKELEKIVEKSSCLEIGCGTGISSLWLARNGCDVCAIDYTDSSVELVRLAADKLGLKNIKVMKHDATNELPFKQNEFDYIFQAGLLEHFEEEEQISLLKMWKKYSKHMISLIPNKASLPYQIGKKIQEDEGRWKYGRETPRHSFIHQFEQAGIEVEREYTIGVEWALRFLPENHYLIDLYKRLLADGFSLEEYMQGYLLVTIGTKLD